MGRVDLVSDGASRGILIMWNRRAIDLVNHYVGNYVLACHFRSIDNGVEWGFADIYWPTLNSNRRSLWDEMASIYACWNIQWCFGGDYNITRFSNEREGSTLLSQNMSLFSELIFDLNLVNLPLEGGSYSWLNGRSRS